MTASHESPLPDYEKPPVIEVVLGAQFGAIEGFQAPHLGLFWQKLRGGYPKIETAMPLANIVERFDSRPPAEAAQVDFLNAPPLPRTFFIDDTDCWLVQLQPDHLVQNWRKTEQLPDYPRFPAVLDRFMDAWATLKEFCREQSFDPPKVNQLEVTYINHIPAHEGWDTASDIGQVFVDVDWKPGDRFLPAPEAIGWKMSFPMPERCGRLHFSVRPAVRRAENTPVLLCELIARGMPVDESDSAIQAWFLLGREWIVRGFADLTKREFQERFWRRKT